LENLMTAATLSSIAELSSSLASLVANVGPSLVSVRSHRSLSSGFVWRSGLVVTADEALAEEGEVAVIFPGGEVAPAKIAGRDPTTDVAVLRVGRSDLPAATFADRAPDVGTLALAIGAHEGAPTAALGVVGGVAGPWHSIRGGEIDARIELDLRLKRSAEGGLAVDATGRAFGMAVIGPRRTTLVIPVATIDRVASTLERQGRIPRGYLGLGLQPVTISGTQEAGAIVISVDLQGPGAAAGFVQGDILTAWNSTPLRSLRALLRSLTPDSVGREAAITILRGGETREIRLTVGERPPA
jgi:S1-C subfamily serine protease